MNWKKFLEHRAFTILELLVVIAVVSIVAITAIALLSNARSRAQDVQQIRDIRAIFVTMMSTRNYQTGDFVTSSSTPNNIDGFLFPTNNSTNNGIYGWLDNTGDPESFCTWSTMRDQTEGAFFVANPNGTGYASWDPTGFVDCQFRNNLYTLPDSDTFICHFPTGNPTGFTTEFVGPGAAATHLGHGDHIGDCYTTSRVRICYEETTIVVPPSDVSTYTSNGAELGACS